MIDRLQFFPQRHPVRRLSEERKRDLRIGTELNAVRRISVEFFDEIAQEFPDAETGYTYVDP